MAQPEKNLRQGLLWGVLVVTVLSGILAYRYFRIAPELRYATSDALWQALPYGLLILALLVIVWPERKASS